MTTPPDEFRRDALRAITTAYTATHGHPLDRDEMGHTGMRWTTSMRVAVAAIGVLAVVGTVIGGWLLGQKQAHGQARQPLGAVEATETAEQEGAEPEGESPVAVEPVEVVVHVAGEVDDPGVVYVPAGSRAADAIDAAGGATADADLGAINLARVVEDGEQLYVPQPGERVPATGDDPSDSGAGGGGKINLNTASAEELQTLPGIGPAMAERITAWRESYGEFNSVEQLMEIRGVGPRVFADLQDKVTV